MNKLLNLGYESFFLFFLLLQFFTLQTAAGQSDEKPLTTKVGVQYQHGQYKAGWLYAVKDSSVLFLRSPNKVSADSSILLKKSLLMETAVKDMAYLRVKKKGAAGKGALIGAGIGVAFGVTVGLLSGDDSAFFEGGEQPFLVIKKEGKAVAGGLIFGAIGGLVGAAIGSLRVRIPINGNQLNYDRKKKKLQRYLR